MDNFWLNKREILEANNFENSYVLSLHTRSILETKFLEFWANNKSNIEDRFDYFKSSFCKILKDHLNDKEFAEIISSFAGQVWLSGWAMTCASMMEGSRLDILDLIDTFLN